MQSCGKNSSRPSGTSCPFAENRTNRKGATHVERNKRSMALYILMISVSDSLQKNLIRIENITTVMRVNKMLYKQMPKIR